MEKEEEEEEQEKKKKNKLDNVASIMNTNTNRYTYKNRKKIGIIGL